MALEDLGSPLTGSYPIAGGEARLFERGATITGPAGEIVVAFDLPMIGNPRIARPLPLTIAPPRDPTIPPPRDPTIPPPRDPTIPPPRDPTIPPPRDPTIAPP